jgi:secretory phospholipase A2
VSGTKWCGYRNVATSRNDLGIFEKTDACCRNHDLCPDNIHSGETKHRLLNTDSYTASNCDCDEKFFSCLKDIGSVTSYIVGFGYFTGLGLKCFRRDYPIVECKQYKYNFYSMKNR